MDEVDVQPINFGDELGHGVEPGLHRAPVVPRRPIVRQLLDGRELKAQVCGDGFYDALLHLFDIGGALQCDRQIVNDLQITVRVCGVITGSA